MELENRINRGSRAKEVIENEIYQEAFEALEQEILTQWGESPARDQEGREKLYLMLGITRRVKGILQTVMETGKLAEVELLHRQTMLDRAKETLADIW
jgi:hypothetical protein